MNAAEIDHCRRLAHSLLGVYSSDVVEQWLNGVNPHLGDRRPIDLLRVGRVQGLLDALAQERAESFS
ncbi:MAG TPA: antitoxin Xre/MbcA/ParS toxin-binding domain-containing protein [Solirubrobacteraceae bacterium]|nr:antitoxin Xre/MbcA/ParS toxin-binding domain-containing protein [Solirubrobacteraceae bacterium]